MNEWRERLLEKGMPSRRELGTNESTHVGRPVQEPKGEDKLWQKLRGDVLGEAELSEMK